MRAPNADVAYDPTGRRNGRGAYVCRDASCITIATQRGALARTLEAPIPATLRAELESAAGLSTSTEPGGVSGQE